MSLTSVPIAASCNPYSAAFLLADSSTRSTNPTTSRSGISRAAASQYLLLLPQPAKTALRFVLLSNLPSPYLFSSFLWLLSGQNRVTYLATHSHSLTFQPLCTRIVCLSVNGTHWV